MKKKLFFLINCGMCGSEDEKISKVEESIEILRIRCLIKNK